MPCDTYTLIGNEQFLATLNKRVCSERIPLTGGMDLTNSCNLSCVHCYVKQDGSSSDITTEQACSYIDAAVEAGCLFFLLTGGEPLLRSDFKEIYQHAKRAGLIVSLFTNGTLIDQVMADFLADYPPHIVEISIYGATANAHDRITGVDGSFEQAMRGLGFLKERGLDVMLKTILMTLNKDEIEGMLELARENEVRFRVDGAIFPRLDGDKSPLAFRLSPKEVVEMEFMQPDRAKNWVEFMDRLGEVKSSESLYDCGAGVSCFHISAEGRLKPCIMAPGPSYDLKKIAFKDAWEQMAEISDRKPGKDYPCTNCERRLLCDSCPGFFGLEMGDEEVYSEYVCEIAKEREGRLGKPQVAGDR